MFPFLRTGGLVCIEKTFRSTCDECDHACCCKRIKICWHNEHGVTVVDQGAFAHCTHRSAEKPSCPTTMGGCLSTVDRVGKERSDAIDKMIEEDQKRFKRECKILLLGTPLSWLYSLKMKFSKMVRVWRVREEHNCKTDEDHTPGRFLREWISRIHPNDLQKCFGIGSLGCHVHEKDWPRVRGIFK